MNTKIGPYHVVEFPADRRFMANLLDLTWSRHCMYGLLEVDVTDVKRYIEENKARTGELLSFTGYLIFCLARAVSEDSGVQAWRKGRKQLVLFDDVEVGIMIERKTGEKRVLTSHVIRGANHKTYRDIHREIRAVQADQTPPSAESLGWFRSAMLLPWPLSRLFRAVVNLALRLDPTFITSMAGTVGITAVGMFGEGHGGWGIAPVSHSLDLIAGSTAWKPAIVAGRIEPREILNLTVVFDHDVIDGAPAARFARRLVELIESGYGLESDLDLG